MFIDRFIEPKQLESIPEAQPTREMATFKCSRFRLICFQLTTSADSSFAVMCLWIGACNGLWLERRNWRLLPFPNRQWLSGLSGDSHLGLRRQGLSIFRTSPSSSSVTLCTCHFLQSEMYPLTLSSYAHAEHRVFCYLAKLQADYDLVIHFNQDRLNAVRPALRLCASVSTSPQAAWKSFQWRAVRLTMR